MYKVLLLLLSTSLITTSAYAGGSLFGHKHKTANVNGVYSIDVHICDSLECPDVRIVEGQCDGTNMSKHWGVCVCDKGYVASGDHCDPCPADQVSDGISGCQSCPEGTYRVNETDTECTECPEPCGDDECCLGPEVCGHATKGGFKDSYGQCHLYSEEDGTGTICPDTLPECVLSCDVTTGTFTYKRIESWCHVDGAIGHCNASHVCEKITTPEPTGWDDCDVGEDFAAATATHPAFCCKDINATEECCAAVWSHHYYYVESSQTCCFEDSSGMYIDGGIYPVREDCCTKAGGLWDPNEDVCCFFGVMTEYCCEQRGGTWSSKDGIWVNCSVNS